MEKKKKKVGRPLKCTGANVRKFCSGMLLGCTVSACAARAGVTTASVRKWWIRGVEAINLGDECELEAPFVHFVREVLRNKGEFQYGNLELVAKAAKGGQMTYEKIEKDADGNEVVERRYAKGEWKAAQWLVKSKYSKSFGDHHSITEKKTVDITSRSINVDVQSNLTVAEQMQLAQLLAKSKQPILIENQAEDSA